MSRLATTLVLYSLVATAQAQSPPQPSKPAVDKKDECSIAGMVVKLEGSEPIKGATVQLVSTDDRANSISVRTDGGGGFQIKRIVPGRYRLTVSRNRFVSQEYGERKPGDPGSALTLSRGQDLKDLLFRLIPSAVIAGRVLDEDGEPLPNAGVSALREAYNGGKRKLSLVAQCQTNDLGEYRLFGLAPGKYLVRVAPRGNYAFQSIAMQRQAEPETAYGHLYYPGVPEASKASPIRIKAGEEIRSIEILMHRYPAYRIRGHVYNQIARRSGQGMNLMLVPRGGELDWERAELQARVDAADGAFEIRDVLPGSYALQALWFDEDKARFSQVNVDVSNADLDGVSIVLSPGVSISGRILWDGPPALQEAELRVWAAPVEGITFGSNSARVDPKGAFTLQEIADGTYQPQVWGQSKDCFIKDIHYGTATALEDGFTVSRGASASLEITLSSRGARVQGSVLDADNLPAAGVWVVLVPEAKLRSRHELYKRLTTDQYGHFEFRDIAPGEYKVFSWEDVEEGAWENPDFLKVFEQKGERVEVKEADQKSVNVAAIRIASTENLP